MKIGVGLDVQIGPVGAEGIGSDQSWETRRSR